MQDCHDIAFSSLVDLLHRRSVGASAATGYTFLEDGDEAEVRLTFAELADESGRLASALLANCHRGDRAILFFPAGVDFLKGLFGCLRAGVIGVPVAYQRLRKPSPVLASIVADSGATLLITTDEVLAERERFLVHNPGLAGLRWMSVNDLPLYGERGTANGAHFDPGAIAFLQYTSGSTGSPKGVCLTHRALMHNLGRMQELLHLSPEECVGVSWLPAYHDMGLIGHILQAVHTGADLVLMSPMSFVQKPLRWLSAISRYRATITCGPNFAFELCTRQIKRRDCEGLDLRSWQVACVGAEPISPRVLDEFTKAFEPFGFCREVFYPCYGLAESTLMVTGGHWQEPPIVRSIGREALENETVVPAAPGDTGAKDFVGCGRPVPDLDVRIVDPATGRPCRADRIGEVWVSGPSVAAGYWGRPDESDRVFRARIDGTEAGGYLRTGDLGFFLDGELFVAGRLKDMIIIRGRKLHPQDVEEVVTESHAALRNCDGAAFSVEEAGKEQLIVVHELDRHHDPDDREPIIAAIRSAIAESFALQAHTVALIRFNTLPKTSSGKVRRQECRRLFVLGELDILSSRTEIAAAEPAASARESSGPEHPARSRREIRRWLVRRLADHLKCDEAGIDASRPFSAFGLDSVTMVGISGELQGWLGRAVPPTLLYDAPNIEALSRALTPEEGLAQRALAHAPIGREPIAIVGMGCRLPGAGSPAEFWRLLAGGVDAVGAVPNGRWPSIPGEIATTCGGFLDSVDRFDASFFGISPREAAYLDPQHRLLLEVSWEALEDAGLPADRLAGESVGVFVGVSSNDYGRILAAGPGLEDAYSVTGNSASMAANRISYHFDFRGPSLAIDTACSSSLVSVHLACESLRRGECGVALAGGVNLMLTPDVSVTLTRAMMLSRSGRCRTFDALADGYVRGEGCGVVVLKPLASALRDGDRVLAVVLGSAVNQDGKSNGITAPSSQAQAALIRAALADAGVGPERVGYVESHGTGTVLGDPIEFSALQTALGTGSTPCAVSTVKTNLGHLESAGGIAGLMKAVLQLQHGAIAPHLHLKALNPHIKIEGTRFFIPTEFAAWPGGPTPRVAGVSSFGFGGSNAHVVLSEAPIPVESSGLVERPGHLLTLSAHTEPALRELASRYHDYLFEETTADIADIAFTASAGRSHRAHRLAIRGNGRGELATGLAEFLEGQPSNRVHAGRATGEPAAGLAFLFTGQGSQRTGMGGKLYASCPPFRDAIDRCEAVLAAVVERPLRHVLEPGDHESQDGMNAIWAQPALFAFEFALAETWRSWGIEPAAVLGHSLGEYVAACVAGVFSLEDALQLVVGRARLMDALPDCGAMAAVLAPIAKVEQTLFSLGNPVDVAAMNGPEQVVLSGDRDAMRLVREAFRRERIATHALDVTRAFHSRLIDPMLDELEQIAGKARFGPPRIPVISNLSGRVAGPEIQTAGYWSRHAREPVRFQGGIEWLEAGGFEVFLEVGPTATLSSLGRLCTPADAADWVPSLRGGGDERSDLLDALGRLYVRGVSVHWRAFHAASGRRLIAVPTYPFERSRHWIDVPASLAPAPQLPASDAALRVALDPAQWVPRSRWEIPADRWANSALGDLGRAAVNLGADHHTERDDYSGDHHAERDDYNGDDHAQRDDYRKSSVRRAADRFAAAHVQRAFRDLGFFPSPGVTWTTETLAARLTIKPSFHRLLGRMLEMLAEDGWLLRDGDRWEPGPAAWDDIEPGRLLQELLGSQPDHEAELTLADQCGRRLAAVLRGDVDPLSILFPDGSPDLLARIYGDAPVARASNRLVAGTIARGIESVPADRIVRIVEIGAGTGGTTAHVLAKLPRGRCEYLFTDVSSLFINHARERFREHRFVQYRPLDIERDPAQSGVAPHQFDIVLAANVLHATSDLKRSLANVRQLLAPGGWLVLLEGTGRERIFDLVFGLTAGWWKYADLDLRPDYPLIARASWLSLLESEGFTDATAVAPTRDAHQVVFLAKAPAAAAMSRNHSGRAAGAWLMENPGWMVTRGLAGIENAGHSANRWVDLDPSLSLESSLDQLASELLDPGDEPFVAFRDGQRYVAARNLAANGDGPADGENGAIPALRCVEPADRRKLIQDAARSELARTLRLPEHAIEVDRPMVSFGLDSLMAIQLKNRLEAQAGVSISIVKLLEGLTVAQLAAEIDQTLSATLDRPESENGVTPNGHHGGTVGSHRNGDELNLDFPPRDASIDRIEDRSSLDQDEQDAGLVPLSEGQRALWFVYQLAPQSPAYNFVYAARIASDIVEWALRKAVGILFERHPLLRSTFSMPGRTPLYRDHDRINPAVEIIDAARWTRADLIEQVRAAAHLPFDLENGPCVRIALYRAGPGESVLSLAVHHILADLWSMNLLVDELRVLYAEVLAGRPTKLPAPSARYADYVRWQRDWLVGRQGALAWKFWKAALADAPPSLDLPADRPRPKVQTYRGSAVSCPIDPDQFARLRDLAAREQTTLFVVLLSAFLVLLRRYTGQDDLVIGTATAGRGRPEWERVVGYFLNQVPLRVRVDVQSDFVDLIRRAQRVVLSALEHQDFPFSVMVERLRPARDPSRPPIFQVMFIWDKSIEFSAQQPSDSHPFGAGRPIEPLVMEQCGAPFDLTLIVFENGSDLSASIRYNVDLFDATTIERMAGHFRSLLSGIVDDARRPVGELPVLSPEETSHVLGGTDGSGNKQARQLRPFPLLFEDQVERSPAATAVVFDGLSTTYRDLNARANRLAHHLRRLGTRAGDLVGICLPRSSEMITTVLAVWKAGAAYLPLDPTYPRLRLMGMIDDARPGSIVTTRDLAPRIEEYAGPVVILDECRAIENEPDTNPTPCVGPDELAYAIFTSGSTGKPKAALLRHRGLSNLSEAQVEVFGLGPGDRALQFASLSFDASVFEIVMPLRVGATLVVAGQSAIVPGPDLVSLIERERLTTVLLPPSVLGLLPHVDLPDLRTLIVAGEACPASVVSQWAPGRRFFNAYGPTETTVWASTAICSADGKPPSIGRPIANTRLLVLDDHMQALPAGVPGELYIAGPGVALGYLNRPELTLEHFVPNPYGAEDDGVLYKTGDMVRLRTDGELEFLGRRDHQIKIRGYRIDTGEVREVLRSHPAVQDALVVAQTLEGCDSPSLVGYVACAEPPDCPIAEIRSFLRERLPYYMVPASLVPMSALPLTANGKVDRSALPLLNGASCRHDRALVQKPAGGSDAAGPVEAKLAQIWTEVLKNGPVGNRDNFFDLGGASLQTLEVVALAERAGISLTPELILQHQSIAELAPRCKLLTGATPPSASVPAAAAKPDSHSPASSELTRASTRRTVIESLGTYIPDQRLSTQEVVAGCRVHLDLPIERMTGIKSRRIAGEREYSIDLAAKALADCLARSAYGPDEIDLLICCNISRCDGPGSHFSYEPSTAARLQERFGLVKALAFDLSNACAGTFTAIAVADTFFQTGMIRNALIVSGEYITHLTRTAQLEIESFVDPRLACLTLGDSGVAILLASSDCGGAGFEELDLMTLGAHSDLCVARASERPHGGAIMLTDAVRASAITIQQAVRHAIETLQKRGWPLESIDQLIMHQTSETTLDGAVREINRVAGREVCDRSNTLYNLSDLGNTATNTHMLALASAIRAGRIGPGSKVVFAISGSGQTVGTALYQFDGTPDRLVRESGGFLKRSPFSAPASNGHPARRVRVAAVGTAPEPAASGRSPEALAMAVGAAECCIHDAAIDRTSIGLILHAGVYRDDFQSEPALAAVAAGRLGINHQGPGERGEKTLAFDLTNGAVGPLYACLAAAHWIIARRASRALVLATEVENNARFGPDALIGLRETGSALLLEESTGHEGFGRFVFRAFPEHVDDIRAFTVMRGGAVMLRHERSPEWERHASCGLKLAVGELLEREGLRLDEITLVLPPLGSGRFVALLAETLSLPRSCFLDVTGEHRDEFTSSLGYGFLGARVSGRARPGDVGLILSAGSGGQVGCCVYYF